MKKFQVRVVRTHVSFSTVTVEADTQVGAEMLISIHSKYPTPAVSHVLEKAEWKDGTTDFDVEEIIEICDVTEIHE